MLFPTTLVGSYPQPGWLIDREKLSKDVPRVRRHELWRIPEAFLAEAQDDATIAAIKAQEEAGLDILTDGEIRRESYSNRFATALDGVDIENPGVVPSRTGSPSTVPRIVGEIRRARPVEVDDLKFLKRHTDRQVKITLPGPFTMSQQAKNEHYDSEEAVAMAYAGAVNEEMRDLFAAGADIVQIDEPYMQASPQKAEAFGLTALNAALDGIDGTTAVHICFGYAALVHDRPSGYSFLGQFKNCSCKQVSFETAQSKLDCSVLTELKGKKLMVGVIDLSDMNVETPQTIAERAKRALPYAAKEDIILAPDCGMKYLPRDVAFGKIQAMAAGAKLLRAEFGG